jgi:hypothetical protein
MEIEVQLTVLSSQAKVGNEISALFIASSCVNISGY